MNRRVMPIFLLVTSIMLIIMSVLCIFLAIDCRHQREAAALASTGQAAQLATCTSDLSHQTIRINNVTSGWTLIYDHQERPSLQVFNGLGQIGLGAAVPQNVGLRFAIRYSVPVTVAGDPQGAQVVYYNNATRGFSEPYPPVSFERAWATR